MNMSILKDALMTWIRVETWYTPHAYDEKRYYRALKTAFDKLGFEIAYDDFKEAMIALVQEHHSISLDQMDDSLKKVIERRAQLAEDIASYLREVSEE